MTRDKVLTYVMAALVLILQIVVAPYISVEAIVPSFPLAFVLALATARAHHPNYLLSFVLGLLCDLFGSGPVGAFALLLVLATLAISLTMRILDADVIIVHIFVVIVCAFVVNIIYGVLMVGATDGLGFVEALCYRSLPCGLYNSIIALVFLPVVLKFCRADVL
jgi:rod shape-determining protein MreD